MSLSSILEELVKLKPFIDEDVNSGPYETMTARRGRRNQAVESYTRLKREYTDTLRKTAAFILVVGDKRDTFVSLATEHFGCYSNDPDTFYADLVDRIPPTLYLGKESIANLFQIVGRHLEDKALDMDIIGYQQLLFKQQYQRAVHTREEFLALVKEAMVEQLGGELVGIQAARSISNEAIQKEHTARFTPILLPTGDEKFALTVAKDLERITNRIFVVSAGRLTKTLKAYGDVLHTKEPEQESVGETLKKISEQLKK